MSNESQMWKELRNFIAAKGVTCVTGNEVYQKIQEIERRHLPERVASLLRNIDPEKMRSPSGNLTCGGFMSMVNSLAAALESGNLEELKTWAK